MSKILHVNLIFIGAVFAINAISGGLIQIYSGYLGDKYGFKRTILIFSFGSVFSIFSLFLISHFTTSAEIFIPVFIVSNLVVSLYQPSTNALLSLSSETALSGFSTLRIAANLGWAIGPALGGIIITIYGFSFIYLVASAASLISFLMYFMLRDIGKTGQFINKNMLINDRRMTIFGVSITFLFVVVSQFSVTLSIYANEFMGVSYSSVGLIYFTNGIVVVLFQWPIYLIVRRIGMWNGMLAGTVLYIMGYFSMAMDHHLIQFLVSMFILTLGENFVTPTGNAIVSQIAKGKRLGSYMGLYNFFNSFGRGMGPSYGSFLLSAYTNPFDIWGFAVLPGGIAFLLLAIQKFRMKEIN